MNLAQAELAGATDPEPAVATVDLVPVDSAAALGAVRTISALAVHTHEGWTALAEEIEVAADGDTVEEAFQNIREAIDAVLEVDGFEGRPQTPPDAVLALIDSHRGTEPMQVYVFQAKG